MLRCPVNVRENPGAGQRQPGWKWKQQWGKGPLGWDYLGPEWDAVTLPCECKGESPECPVEPGAEPGAEGAVVLSQGGVFVSLNHLCEVFRLALTPRLRHLPRISRGGEELGW